LQRSAINFAFIQGLMTVTALVGMALRWSGGALRLPTFPTCKSSVDQSASMGYRTSNGCRKWSCASYDYLPCAGGPCKVASVSNPKALPELTICRR
ncbi:MAG: hypothetical protein ACREBC_10715, partial [Pyrinomonadaceae bacterium]